MSRFVMSKTPWERCPYPGLKAFLESTNYNQTTLAAATGISASVISQYVKGDIEPTIQKLLALEDLTGLTPEESKRMSNILMDVGIDYNCSWEYVKNWLLDDRLRELDEADKDGRVVVLPCKVG